MKRILFKTSLITLCSFYFLSFAFSAEIKANNGTVNWNKASSWNLNRLPTCGDIIVIPQGSLVNVTDQIKLTSGTKCEQTQINIIGKLIFSSGKKINLSAGTSIYVYPSGEINPSQNGAGSSESIEIGTQIFWKASDGILKGKALDLSTQSSSVKTVFGNEVKKETQKFVLANASQGGIIKGTKGTKIYIKANSILDSRGERITGAVDVELVEVYDRTTMIRLNKATMGLKTNQEKEVLTSGGEIFLRISQNDVNVQLREPVKINMMSENPQNNMAIFNGSLNDNNEVTWTETKEKLALVKDTFNTDIKSAYSFSNSSWGWINIDKFKNDPRDKTKLRVKLPDGFDNKNTAVLITFEEDAYSLAQLDIFENNYFADGYGLCPIGIKINIITMSFTNNTWILGNKKVTVSRDETINFTMDDLLLTNGINLQSILDNL